MIKELKFCKSYEWAASPDFTTSYLPKALNLLGKIENDPELRRWCKAYALYRPQSEHLELKKEIDWFFNATYAEGLVITDYMEILDQMRTRGYEYLQAEKAWLSELSLPQLMAVLAAHFRRDYHSNGSLVEESIPSGAMLRIIEELNCRFETGKVNNE